jgi:hypothetical protein
MRTPVSQIFVDSGDKRGFSVLGDLIGAPKYPDSGVVR